MSKFKVFSTGIATLFAVLVLLTPAALSQGVPEKDAPPPGDFDPASVAVDEIYQAPPVGVILLTDEEVLNAIPLPIPVLSEAEAAAASRAPETPTGPPEYQPGSLPDPRALATVGLTMANVGLMDAEGEVDWMLFEEADFQQGVRDLQATGPDSTSGYTYPPPFTRYPVNSSWQSHRFFPYSAIGRLYFKIPGDNRTYACTASVAGGRAVWTAGHCLYTKGKGYHTNMEFIPAHKLYGGIREPFGRFGVTRAVVLQGWSRNQDFAYDIGMFTVADRNGFMVSEYTGSLGRAWNISATQHYNAFGYPARFHNGTFLYVCQASTSSRDSREGPDPVGIGCDLLQGASGGPWMINFRPYNIRANTNYINGVFSFHKNGKNSEMFASYFGSGAKSLWDWGKNR